MVERFRAAWSRILTPLASWLLARGVTPDAITWIGTAGVVISALVCFPQGWLWQGAVAVTVFAFSDMIDGRMARLSGHTTSWGAFLDSTLDRLGDGAIFGGIMLYFVGTVDGSGHMGWAAITLAALVLAQVTSYIKAKADSLGVVVPGGIAARADRVIIILIAAFLAGLGVRWVLELAVLVLAVLSGVTVAQRMYAVHRQLTGSHHVGEADGHRHLGSPGTSPAGPNVG